MVMATHLCTSSPLLPAKIIHKPSFPKSSSLPINVKHQSTPLKRSSVLATATTTSSSIGLTESPTSVQSSKSKSLPFRVGHGFDLHRLEPGYPLIIGGISIPHNRGCEAHSDGSCVCCVIVLVDSEVFNLNFS